MRLTDTAQAVRRLGRSNGQRLARRGRTSWPLARRAGASRCGVRGGRRRRHELVEGFVLCGRREPFYQLAKPWDVFVRQLFVASSKLYGRGGATL